MKFWSIQECVNESFDWSMFSLAHRYLVAINFGDDSTITNFVGSHATIPGEAVVTLVHGAPYAVEDEIDPSSLEIGAHGAVVVSWDYVAKEL